MGALIFIFILYIFLFQGEPKIVEESPMELRIDCGYENVTDETLNIENGNMGDLLKEGKLVYKCNETK